MLRGTLRSLSKRTPGYVFWRQSTLTELEHSKRHYLLSERPVPVGEVARRMTRVKTRYAEADDAHERNLLRGEYRYFTGKVCDLRAARPGDLIAFLQCGSFFGLWDTAQVEKVMRELLLRVAALTANELAALFVALPGLRKQQSELHRRVGVALVSAVFDMTVAECIAVCGACDESVPVQLTHNLLQAIEPEVDSLEPSQLVDILDAIQAAPIAVHGTFAALADTVTTKAIEACNAGKLSCMDLAVLFSALGSQAEDNAAVKHAVVTAFSAQKRSSCARSVAMMFSSVTDALSTALLFAQSMEERVLFLATEFTSTELLAVFRVYLSCLVSMCVLRATPPPPAVAACSRSKVDGGNVTAEQVLILQRQGRFRHVLSQLSDQLVSVLDGAATYVSLPQQMDLLAIYASVVDDLSATEGTTQPSDIVLQQVPQTRAVMQLLSCKLIASSRQCSLEQLVKLLELGNKLGPSILPDSVVAAAVQQLTVRDWSLSPSEAGHVNAVLGSFTALRAEHQRYIHCSVMPKLRGFM